MKVIEQLLIIFAFLIKTQGSLRYLEDTDVARTVQMFVIRTLKNTAVALDKVLVALEHLRRTAI